MRSTIEVVGCISAYLRKVGCRCSLDENRDVVNQKPVLQCANTFKPLCIDVESEEPIGNMCWC